jgi:hypothetical protein
MKISGPEYEVLVAYLILDFTTRCCLQQQYFCVLRRTFRRHSIKKVTSLIVCRLEGSKTTTVWYLLNELSYKLHH